MGWWLLHEAKRISRQLNLLLSLASIVIIGLISLGQPWIHFQVPLAPLGDPGFRTIPIDTVFVVRCSDMACLHEYDQNAYLLDFAWAFLLVASVTNFILCIILINIIFSTSSNVPLLDFSNVIITALTGTALRPSPEEPNVTTARLKSQALPLPMSCTVILSGTCFPACEQRFMKVERESENKEQDPGSHAALGRGPATRDAWPPNTCTHAGTSLILGILFYLMQAREYLQEGMTYKLGCSFYLAWTGVFFFVMIGRGQGRVGVWGLGMCSRMQMRTGVG
ncbi:hypothetical protein MG293_015723 [Ovis ammon polii]|uniref:Uncharacterized protein n=1 Tax=Ovis ammon polii TaxID=230172 RepID=A0AAD4TVV1_OVIAM|nr:hypothetical protein MG293_015723 [Ovis ammon polii]